MIECDEDKEDGPDVVELGPTPVDVVEETEGNETGVIGGSGEDEGTMGELELITGGTTEENEEAREEIEMAEWDEDGEDGDNGGVIELGVSSSVVDEASEDDGVTTGVFVAE